MAAGGAGDRARSRDVGETLSTETEAESEGETGAGVSILYVVWTNTLARYVGSGMEPGEGQSRGTRSRRHFDQNDRRGRRRGNAISGRNRAIAEAEDISAATGASDMDREGKWKI